eukprot:TRINITY_DN7932_c1_g3_i1.p1 TRINITY_DN7932_c1_g3~~TRINITY_DN7932_c1_g3_i1.p1  ORF type:complete len:583 (+),score=144.87 TRINITY_DN7932_c1_g3_i1:93-1841(+)
MAISVVRQPWITRHPARKQCSRRSRTSKSKFIEEGDKVQFWNDFDRQWMDGEVGQTCDGDESSVVTVLNMSGDAEKVPSNLIKKAAKISLIAPGGGLGSVGCVYSKLDADSRFQVDVVGRKGILYDAYPECWDCGAPPPNLASFGADIVSMEVPEQTDCFICGSRGGQVVLPEIWRSYGNESPPSVVINGGCAMSLPGPPFEWPDLAVTVMLLGGQDFFKGSRSSKRYLDDTCKEVSPRNSSTILIYLPEMKHMPQLEILDVLMTPMVLAALSAKDLPLEQGPLPLLREALGVLEVRGWGGHLRYTSAPGEWKEMLFGRQVPDRPPRPPSPRAPKVPREPCPRGTAVSVLPIKVALQATSRTHKEAAMEARQMAAAMEIYLSGSKDSEELDDLKHRRQRLLEFAAGQDAEAWAAEGEELEKMREQGQQSLNREIRGATRELFQELQPQQPRRQQQLLKQRQQLLQQQQLRQQQQQQEQQSRQQQQQLFPQPRLQERQQQQLLQQQLRQQQEQLRQQQQLQQRQADSLRQANQRRPLRASDSEKQANNYPVILGGFGALVKERDVDMLRPSAYLVSRPQAFGR